MPSIFLPNTIDLNTQKSAPEIQSNFDALQAALNGGLDEVNVPNLTAAFTSYKRLQRAATRITAPAANTYGFFLTNIVAANTLTVGILVADAVIELDPAPFAANARTTKLNLTVTATPNAVAPAITFTTGLYPVATYGGASGAAPSIATVGAIVSGSSTAIASPAAAARTKASSGDFNFPAAGAYHLAVITSGVPAAGSITDLAAYLDVRQV